MMLNVHKKPRRLIRDGEKRGERVWRWGKREIIHFAKIYINWGSHLAEYNVLLFF